MLGLLQSSMKQNIVDWPLKWCRLNHMAQHEQSSPQESAVLALDETVTTCCSRAFLSAGLTAGLADAKCTG